MKKISCEILIIGSGPGASVSADELTRGGRDVLLVEEGEHIPMPPQPYSLEELRQMYRYEGLSPGLGNPKMAFLEARCLGGAAQVNAGLYNLPDKEVIDAWGESFGLYDASFESLQPFFRANESLLSLSIEKEPFLPGSDILTRGAKSLGWQHAPVKRMWKFNGPQDIQGQRVGIRDTILAKAIAQGLKVLTGLKISRLLIESNRVVGAQGCDSQGPVQINSQHTFVCGGAVQTPYLLINSGIRRDIGTRMKFHPAIRIPALFDSKAHDIREGVPVVQVKEFKPRITLGGSYSSKAHLSLWLAGHPNAAQYLARQEQMGLFYALICPEGSAKVIALPGLNHPLVSFQLTDGDMTVLGEGLWRLGQLLFAAGAKEVFSPIKGSLTFKDASAMKVLAGGVRRDEVDLSTIHLFSSCPMGERDDCPLDSWGRLKQVGGLYVNDASMLPDTPKVNPQAVIMAFARRNAQHFCENKE